MRVCPLGARNLTPTPTPIVVVTPQDERPQVVYVVHFRLYVYWVTVAAGIFEVIRRRKAAC